MATIVNGTELVLTGTVGDLWYDDCFTAADVIMALASIGADADIVIRLNSGGGIATEGLAIHAALARHKGKKTIRVEGIAASAASIIAMAGDTIEMALGAVMMIHDPSGYTVGTVKDHELQVRALNALAASMATIYADKSGRDVKTCRADMESELWMTAEEAVATGYADHVGTAANDNAPLQPSAFNYRLYAKAPQPLVALATTPKRSSSEHTPPVETTSQDRQDSTMSQTPNNTPNDPNNGNVVAIDAARKQGADEGRKAALAYMREVNDLCALAGKPQLAADFIAKETAVEAVRTALLEARAEEATARTVAGQRTENRQPATAEAAKKGWDDVVTSINKRFG